MRSIVVVGVLVVGACGGERERPKPAADARVAAPAPAPVPAVDAAAGDDLDRVLRDLDPTLKVPGPGGGRRGPPPAPVDPAEEKESQLLELQAAIAAHDAEIEMVTDEAKKARRAGESTADYDERLQELKAQRDDMRKQLEALE